MDTFEVGTHVTIELDDGGVEVRRIAGYIHGVTDDGLVLKATHKDIPFVPSLAPEVREVTRGLFDEVGTLDLRLELLRRREYAYALKGRRDMVELLTDLACERALEVAAENKVYSLYEYSVPVLTYVGLGRIGLMEASSDVMDEVDVVTSAAGLDEELPRLMDGEFDKEEDGSV